ncbi:MAG: hypothetical protein NE330_04940, partial [Lentisphaeraceae bacterium]|nr:hypothetical protein [Lentisphaeraceae bacterium]
ERYNMISYVPLRLKARSKGNRIVHSHIPMFPGYTFACLDDAEKSLISTCNAIVRFIRLSREQEKSLVEELKSISILEQLQDSQEIVVAPEIVPGLEVAIKGGPLKGLTGIVENRKGFHRIVVNVEMICQSVVMEMDSSDLEIVY